MIKKFKNDPMNNIHTRKKIKTFKNIQLNQITTYENSITKTILYKN